MDEARIVSMNYQGKGKILASSWTFVDVLGVMVCSESLLLALFFSSTFIDNERTAFMFFRYAGSLLLFSLPIIWIKIRYKIKSDALGLWKGHYSLKKLALIGCSMAILLAVILRFSPIWQPQSLSITKTSINYLHLIFYPLSIGGGLATVVFAPIAEEVMYRGFLYGYLRTKMAITFGLLLQASLFSVLHLIYIYEDPFQLIFLFFTAIILGILYELTGSLYSSIICHGTLNYLVVVLSVIG